MTTALLAAAHADVSGLLVLLLYVILAVVVLGVVWVVVTRLSAEFGLPSWVPLVVLCVLVVVVLLWLLGGSAP